MLIKDYKDELFNAEESIKNQGKLKGNYRLAPLNGICWTCRKNIYKPIFKKLVNDVCVIVQKEDASFVSGITIEESKKVVTGCPHCNRSYCS